MDANGTAAQFFLEFSRRKLLEQYWPRLSGAVESLTDEQVWWRPNDVSNSIGNLLLHLNGNVRQWLVSSFNAEEDQRNRPAEFDAAGGASAKDLLAMLERTMDDSAAVLLRLTEADLLATYAIQGYQGVRGIDAVYQVVEHFGMHYGQVLYITKLVQGRDLGFYSRLAKTGFAS